MWDYTDDVIDHFKNPRNVGEVKDPDGVGEVGSIACGDALKLTFKLGENGKIADARFKTFGRASAIASSSMLTEMIKGLSPEEALSITNKDIADRLQGLPEEKMHCSVMGREALEAAVADWKGEELPQHDAHEDEGRLICKCFGVTEGTIRKVIREDRLQTLEQVTNYTKAGGACATCHEDLERILQEEKATATIVPVEELKGDQGRPQLTNIQRIRKVEEVIDNELRPALRKDGGDLELVDVDRQRVVVRLLGTCRSCVASQVTLKSFVEARLKELVDPDIIVEEES